MGIFSFETVYASFERICVSLNIPGFWLFVGCDDNGVVLGVDEPSFDWQLEWIPIENFKELGIRNLAIIVVEQ